MYLLDGDDLYTCDEADCEFEADGSGFWLEGDDGDDEFYSLCEVDLDEYDLEDAG